MTAETITLPRSGVTLVDMTETSPDFRAVVSGLVLRIYRDYHGSWNAMTWGGGCNIFKTREEAVADLDSRVIALRASLLPKGAVIFTPAEQRLICAALRLAAAMSAGEHEVGHEFRPFGIGTQSSHLLAAYRRARGEA